MLIDIRTTLTAAALAAGLALPAAAADLKIATWNLEHLAEADGAGCRPREEADYALLRAYADQLDADVVALEEVETAAAAERVFDPETYTIVMSDQPYPAPSADCRGMEGRKILPQRTGFAIRKGIAFTRNPPLEALNVHRDGGAPLRWGVDITIEGRRKLRLLGVHLKSGCPAGNKPDDEDCPVLLSQVPVVEDWIDAREKAGEAFVVLGDFNRRLQPNDSDVWLAWDDLDPQGLDLHIAALEAEGGPRSPQCEGGKYRDYIDHIVLSDRAFRRWDRSSFRELTYAELGDEAPSDHCPVSVRIAK